MKFGFYMPVRVLSGAGCVRDNAPLFGELGTRAFIMSGRSAAQSGSLADVTAALEAAGLAWNHYDRVKPNPSLAEVRAAAAQARAAGADCVVGIGGGSPLDAAKAVAVLAAGEVTDEELLSRRRFDRVLPLAAVPTTAGTGSEVTPYAILTNDALQTKSFLNTEQVYPRLAFLDGRYTENLPREVTVATAIDALSHAAEGYLAVRATPPGRVLALESLRIIGKALPALAGKEALSPENREGLLYASMLAGIVISQSGTTAVHALGYSLTYFKGIDHGAANGYLMAEYLRFIAKSRPEEVGALLSALGVFNVNALERLLEKLLGKIRLTGEETGQFASIAIKAGNIQNTNPRPSEEELHYLLHQSVNK